MAFGFLKTIAKGIGFVAKTGLSLAGVNVGGAPRPVEPQPSYQPPPAQIIPPAPLPPLAQLPFLSYQGGGVGSGPVNTYAPTRAPRPLTRAAPVQRAAAATRSAKPKKRAKPKKLKFGSPAWRKKYVKKGR